ncbi:hypothetical protein [Fortiea contorta]|uniref:hypothetical protein n=1 Tax=Fortiea contorta TaxID=1892405 RepID=UPI0012B55886|nr:hypothetical protein [Fortiea contorta]
MSQLLGLRAKKVITVWYFIYLLTSGQSELLGYEGIGIDYLHGENHQMQST